MGGFPINGVDDVQLCYSVGSVFRREKNEARFVAIGGRRKLGRYESAPSSFGFLVESGENGVSSCVACKYDDKLSYLSFLFVDENINQMQSNLF